MPTSFSQAFGLSRIAGVDIDGDHLELGAAELGLQRVERRHFLAAGHAPCGPQVEQHRPAAPVGERLRRAVARPGRRAREAPWRLGDRDARRPRRAPAAPGGLAISAARACRPRRPRIACKPADPVYPREPDRDARRRRPPQMTASRLMAWRARGVLRFGHDRSNYGGQEAAWQETWQ